VSVVVLLVLMVPRDGITAILANFIDEFCFGFLVIWVQSASHFAGLVRWDWVHSYILLQCHFAFVFIVAALLD